MGKKVDKLVDLPLAELEALVEQAGATSVAALDRILELLFRAEVSIRLSPQPKLALEMALIRMLQEKPVLPIDVLIDKLDTLRQEIRTPGFTPEDSDNSSISENSADDTPFRPSPPTGTEGLEREKTGPGRDTGFVSDPDTSTLDLDEAWARICRIISKKHHSLAANLVNCRLKKSEENALEIEVAGTEFTLKMIQREKNLVVLKQVCEEVFGSRKDIRFSAGNPAGEYSRKKKNDNQLKQNAVNHPLVADAIEIFDGKLIDVKIL
jgi:DNA polymerase-3 subunit gamma/tau